MAQFEIGNKAALKWTEDEVRSIFEKMLHNTIHNDDILCMQDAIMSVDLYRSSVDYLLDKFPVFGKIKEDVNDAIISRINKGALTGKFNPTASIWRMKQSGETDQQQINHQNNGGKFEPSFVVNSPDTAKDISKVLNGE